MPYIRKIILSLPLLFICASLPVLADETDPVEVENRLLTVSTKLLSGRISCDSAIKELEELRILDPQNDAVPYLLSRCHFWNRHYSQAETRILEAINLSRSNTTYKEFLAEIYSESGRSDKAAAIYIGLLKQHPEKYSNPYTLTLLGEQMLAENKDSAAMATFDKALLYDPEYTPAKLGKAEIYFFRDNLPAYFVIMDEFALTPNLNPEAKTGYIEKSIERFHSTELRIWYPQIDSIITHCVRINPSDTCCLKLAGDWFYSTGREELGCSYYDKMLSDNPKSISANIINMQILLAKGDTLSAIETAKNICNLTKGNKVNESESLLYLGDLYFTVYDTVNAYKCYDRAISLNPDNATALNNYAYFLCLDGKSLKKAEKMSRKTLELEPDNASYLDTYGWILHLLGRDWDAIPYFEHALIYGGRDNVEVLEHYAEVLETVGETAKAQVYRNLAKSKK